MYPAVQPTVRTNEAAVHFPTIACKSNTTNRQVESHIFGKLVHVLTTMCMLGFKFLTFFPVRFYERFGGFRRLIIVGIITKCTRRHLFRYGRLIGAINWK